MGISTLAGADPTANPLGAGSTERTPLVAGSGASTPVGETGTVVGYALYPKVSWGVAYDPADGYVYVGNWSGNTVLVFNGTTQVATIQVGTMPTGLAYDPYTQNIWVANQQSGNISLIKGLSVVSGISIGAGTYPLFFAWDPDLNCMFVTLAKGFADEFCASGSSASISVGSSPEGLAYDPQNHFLYVANTGSNTVTILNATVFPFALVATRGVGSAPTGAAYDPSDNLVYITNYFSANVTMILGSSVYFNANVGTEPSAAFYVPTNGLMYVLNAGSNTISPFYPGANIAPFTISVSSPTAADYDSSNGDVYVTSRGGGEATLVSVLLGIRPAVTLLGGSAVSTIDVGQSVYAETNLFAVGSNVVTTSDSTAPQSGLGCNPNPSGPSRLGVIGTACTATSPGTYVLWLNVTDSLGRQAWSYTYLTVDPAPSISLSASVSGGIDLGQSIAFNSSATGGSGVFSYVWQGLPAGCTSSNAHSLTCIPSAAGSYSVSASTTDSNGVTVISSPVSFAVYPALASVTLTASSTSLDVGQNLVLNGNVTGGTGGYTYSWQGLPSGCISVSIATLSCQPTTAGTFTVRSTVTDAKGMQSTSSPVTLTVSPALHVTNVTSGHPAVDLGSSLRLQVGIQGGSGGLTFKWSGLPAGCPNNNSATLSCLPTVAGSFWASVTVTDSNGGSSTSGLVAFTVNPALTTPTVAPSISSATTGQIVVFSAQVSGGTEPLQYAWTGLPTGCSGGNSPDVTCVPSTAGTFSVSVSVTDATGAKVSAAGVSFVVTAAPASQQVSSLNLPIWILLGLVIAVLVMAVLGILLRGPPPRRTVSPSVERPTPPAPGVFLPQPPSPESPSQPPLPAGPSK